jgi:acetoin utilization protein AcuB
MTKNPLCVTADDLLDQVAAAMERGRFRHAPVVAGDRRLLGIVSDRDLRGQKGYLSSTKVTAVLSEPAHAIRPEDPIEHAAQLMLEHQIGALPVVDGEQRVVGIVTTTDLIRAFLDALGGAEAGRIDLGVARTPTGVADAVRAIEKAGATVLGIGTSAVAEGSPRRFHIRVPPADVARSLDALRAAGLAIPAEGAPATAATEP